MLLKIAATFHCQHIIKVVIMYYFFLINHPEVYFQNIYG